MRVAVRRTGLRRRKRGLLVACLCVLCFCQGVCVSGQEQGLGQTISSVMIESAAKQVGGKPVELFIEDAYPLIMHTGLKKLYEGLKSFWLTLAYRDIERVSDMVMKKLRKYLFGKRRLQDKAWLKLRNIFRDHLREWWFTTPLVPTESLQTGVWHALIQLAAEDLPDWCKATQEYEKLKDLVLDEKSTLIRKWVKSIELQLAQGD